MSGFENIERLLSEQTWMKRVAQNLVGDGAADDLVQEAYQAALRSPPTADRPVHAWLGQVLRNKARSRWRGERRREDRELAVAPADDPATPHDHAAVLQTQTLLCETLRDLDEPFRRTLFAHYYEDKSLADIARDEAVPEGTVRWRHHEGLARVRAALDRKPGGRTAWLAGLAPFCTPSPPPSAATSLGKALIVKKLFAVAVAVIAIAALLVVLKRNLGAPDDRAGEPVAVRRPRASPPAEIGSYAAIPNAAERFGTLRLEGQVVDPDGKPVEGAEIVLDLEPRRTTTSEADGSFAFDGLARGDYTLGATRGESLSGGVTHSLTASSDPLLLRLVGGGAIEVEVVDDRDRPIAGARVTLNGRAGSEIRSDARGIALVRPVMPKPYTYLKVEAERFAPVLVRATGGGIGSVGHVVAHLEPGRSLAGRVVDEAGRPIPHASVEAGDSIGITSYIFRWAETTTDDEGRFEFGNLAPRKYAVSARDGVHRSTIVTAIVGPKSDGSPVLVTLTEAFEVRGRVVDATGQPAGDAAVLVASTIYKYEPPQIVHTDADGRFHVGGLAPSPYKLSAETPSASSPRTEVDVAKTGLVDLVLSESGTIAGGAVDDAGSPVPNLAVVLLASFDDPLNSRHAVTDQAGEFVFDGVRAGSYQLIAAGAFDLSRMVAVSTGERHARLVVPRPPRAIGRLVVEGRAPRHATVNGVPTARDGGFVIVDQLRAGNTRFEIRGEDFMPHTTDAVLKPGTTTDLGVIELSLGRTIVGTVVDASQRPVPGAIVSIDPEPSRDGMIDRSDRGERHAVSDDAGAFTLAHVAVATVRVGASHVVYGQSNVLEVADGTGAVVLVLEPIGAARGTVSRDGKPLAGVEVRAQSKSRFRSSTVTAADGSYEFERVPTGTLQVVTTGETLGLQSGTRVSADLEIVANTTRIANLALPSGGSTLQVKPTAKPGATIDLAIMALFEGTQQPNATAVTSAERTTTWIAGSPPASFANVPPGPYTLCAVPVTGSLLDREFMRWLEAHEAELRVVCQPVVVHATNPEPIALEVPSMFPERTK